jgi:hypothetical protein
MGTVNYRTPVAISAEYAARSALAAFIGSIVTRYFPDVCCIVAEGPFKRTRFILTAPYVNADTVSVTGSLVMERGRVRAIETRYPVAEHPTTEPPLDIAELGVDASCGFARYRRGMDEAAIEFIRITPGKENDPHAQADAALEAFSRLRTRLNKPRISYTLGPTHPFYRPESIERR